MVNQQKSFKFPVQVGHISKFQNINQIDLQINRQEQQILNVPSKMFIKKEIIVQNVHQSVSYKCKFCNSFLKFKKIDNYFILTKQNNHHNHSLDKKVSQIPKSKKQMLYRVSSQYITTQKKQSKLLKYKKYLQKVKSLTIIQISVEASHSILYFSPFMKSNNELFGDYAHFDILSSKINLIDLDCEIGIFSGWDNNNRMILFAITIIQQMNHNILIKIFEQFLKYSKNRSNHKNQLKSFIIGQNKMIQDCIIKLQQKKIFNGIYVFHTLDILKSINLKLKLTLKESLNQKQYHISQIVQKVKEVIQIQNAQTGKINLQKLFEEFKQNSKITQILYNLSQNRQKICFWSYQQKFIGLINWINRKVTCFIQEKITQPIIFNEFIQIINQIDKNLYKHSILSIHKCQQRIQQIYDDQQLGQIRMKLQKKIFIFFIKKYIEGLSYMIVHQQVTQNQSIILVKKDYSNQQFRIKNWICECGFRQKVGLPCQHILCVAKLTKIMSYQIFINNRWFKKQREQPLKKK